MRRSVSVALAGALFSTGANAATIYAGTWQNTTFSSSGAATFVLDFVNDDWNALIDLDGSVFGGLDPDPLELGGTFSGFGSSSFSAEDHPTYGDVSGSISGGTLVSALLENLPNPGIASVEINGCVGGGSLACADGSINLSYTVFFSGGFGSAEGIITATPVTVPVPAAAWLFATGLGLMLGRPRVALEPGRRVARVAR